MPVAFIPANWPIGVALGSIRCWVSNELAANESERESGTRAWRRLSGASRVRQPSPVACRSSLVAPQQRRSSSSGRDGFVFVFRAPSASVRARRQDAPDWICAHVRPRHWITKWAPEAAPRARPASVLVCRPRATANSVHALAPAARRRRATRFAPPGTRFRHHHNPQTTR